MILGLVHDAVKSGAAQDKACEIAGVSPRCLQRWRKRGIGDDNRAGPKSAPRGKLTRKERKKLLRVLKSEEFRELSPWQVEAILADQGIYLASASTMYRLLRQENLQNHREPCKEPTKRHRPDAFVATAANQVWSWDITYLLSRVRGAFYYAYLVTDIFSRKIVGFSVCDRECGDLATQLLEETCRREGVDKNQLVLHSDNGSPMKSATLLATLQGLGVATSFSRPSVSNDNPYSESLFRTVKYRPNYPRRPFKSLEEAQEWFAEFVDWYNNRHRHSAIKFVTPDQRHQGMDVEILRRRDELYKAKKKLHPERWIGKTRDWSPITEVRLNPHPQSGGESAA